MVYYASPSFVPSAHPHVNYTSHPHSKDVNNFIGVYSEAGDHSEANLEVRMTGLETGVNDFKTEIKDFRTEIFHKIDILGIKFESGRKEMAHAFENSQEKMAHAFKSIQERMAHAHKEQLSSFANDQQKQFYHFYARGFFGIVGIAALLIGSA